MSDSTGATDRRRCTPPRADVRRGRGRAARAAGRRPGSSPRWTGSGRFTELLGDPQRAYPVIHLTGTNGKTSTARMIDTLLRALGLRTGRFTSPHLERMTERICVDGEPLTDEAVRRAPSTTSRRTPTWSTPTSRTRCRFFETIVGDGVRRVRRRPGRRRRGRGRHGRHLGRHQRRRRAGRGGHPDRASTTRSTSATRRPTIARGEGRDHQARRDRGARRAAPEVGRGAAAPVRRGRRDAGARGPRVRRRHPGAGRRRPDAVAAGAARRATTRSSCRSTAPTRRRTPPSRWPRSRRSSASEPARRRAWCARRSPR